MLDHTTRQSPELKTCAQCGETKPATIEFFYKLSKIPNALRSECKICFGNRQRAYRAADWNRTLERQRAYRAANRERISEHYRAYRDANKGRIAKRMHSYRAANPEIRRAQKFRRRAREANAEGTHTAADIRAQIERQKHRCYWCNMKVGKDYHVDHIVPLSRGGSNWPENIVIACPTCNTSRRNKLPHEWAKGGRLL